MDLLQQHSHHRHTTNKWNYKLHPLSPSHHRDTEGSHVTVKHFLHQGGFLRLPGCHLSLVSPHTAAREWVLGRFLSRDRTVGLPTNGINFVKRRHTHTHSCALMCTNRTLQMVSPNRHMFNGLLEPRFFVRFSAPWGRWTLMLQALRTGNQSFASVVHV